MVKKDFNLKDKLYSNALVGERLLRLDKFERRKIVSSLLRRFTERELESLTGIPRSTLHDWKSLRQCNKGSFVHVSLSSVCLKLKRIDPDSFVDWGRIEQIRDVCNDLLSRRKV